MSQFTINMIYELDITEYEKNYLFQLAKKRQIKQYQIVAIKRMLREIPDYYQLNLKDKCKALNFITYSAACFKQCGGDLLKIY